MIDIQESPIVLIDQIFYKYSNDEKLLKRRKRQYIYMVCILIVIISELYLNGKCLFSISSEQTLFIFDVITYVFTFIIISIELIITNMKIKKKGKSIIRMRFKYGQFPLLIYSFILIIDLFSLTIHSTAQIYFAYAEPSEPCFYHFPENKEDIQIMNYVIKYTLVSLFFIVEMITFYLLIEAQLNNINVFIQPRKKISDNQNLLINIA